MTHPTTVEGWNGSLTELAKSIAAMRYDTQAKFLALLSDELEQQSIDDRDRGRTQLAARMANVTANLDWATNDLIAAWRICEPHMRDEPT